MLFRRTMIIALLLGVTLLFTGCGEDPAPDATDEGNGETVTPDAPVTGDADAVLGEASEDFIAVMDEMPEAAPGQWISFKSDEAEGEFSIAILRSEDVAGVTCLWYQIAVEDVVFQVLLDQAMFDTLKDEMQDFMAEMGTDPTAWLQTNFAEGNTSQLFMPDDDPARMMTFVRSIKMIKIKSDEDIIAIDMTGVPEMVESMIAQNPDMFDQAGAQITAESDSSFQDFVTKVQEAEFVLDFEDVTVANETIGCLTLSITHPDEGTINLAFSNELPIFPLAEASADPVDPENEGGRIYVSGFGFDGAEDLIPGPATQTIPAAMMLQGLMQQ
ncbi:MAG: hypothetical protein R6V62_03170 [Candidatus Fermentibacteraceae bacterium]